MIPQIEQARRHSRKQLLVLLVLVAFIATLWGVLMVSKAGYSAFCGGIVVILAQQAFSRAAFAHGGASKMSLVQGAFKRGMILKWCTVLILSTVLLSAGTLPALPFLTTFCITVVLNSVAPLWFSKN